MLHSVKEANTYLVDRIEKITKIDLPEEEKMVIETCFKNLFYDKLSETISDEKIEEIWAETEEELEGKLYLEVPNYLTILEDCVAQYLAEYFVGDYFSQEELEDIDVG